jgi:hypothetical protein
MILLIVEVSTPGDEPEIALGVVGRLPPLVAEQPVEMMDPGHPRLVIGRPGILSPGLDDAGPQEFRYPQQCQAIVQVVLDDTLSRRRVAGRLPAKTPDDALEARCVRDRPLEAQATGDVLQAVGRGREVEMGIDD